MIPSILIVASASAETHKDLIAKLYQLVPEAANPYGMFHPRLPELDPRLPQVFALLEQAGVHRLPSPSTKEAENNPCGYYTTGRVHAFSKQEYQRASYLWLRQLDQRHFVPADTRNEQRELLVEDRGGSSKRTLLASVTALLARERFCQLLDAEGFVGLAYRPCHLCRVASRPAAKGGPSCRVRPWKEGRRMFEIWPSLDLPPMYDPQVERWTGMPDYAPGRQGPGQFRNPGYADFQPAYTVTALDAVGPFDIARTWEYLWQYQPDVRTHIVSQRFYRFCLKHKVDGTFVPIQIIDA